MFDAVADQACRLLGGHFTALLRYEPDGPVILAMYGAAAVEHFMHVGMRIAAEGDGLVQRVQRSAQAARVDSYGSVPGWNAGVARDLGLTSGVGAPIIIDGRVWGAITVLGSGTPLPASAEGRLGMFAELVAMAIANAQAQTNATALADEQAALLRVAELVARGVTPEEVFAAVATEASSLLDGQAMTLTRFDGEHELVVEAACLGPAPVGTRIPFAAETLPDWLRREDRVVRVDDYTRERDAELAGQFGLAAAVAAPISVQGSVWGMLTATSGEQPLPQGTEHRLQQFAKLVAATLANSQARGELQALADEQTACVASPSWSRARPRRMRYFMLSQPRRHSWRVSISQPCCGSSSTARRRSWRLMVLRGTSKWGCAHLVAAMVPCSASGGLIALPASTTWLP